MTSWCRWDNPRKLFCRQSGRLQTGFIKLATMLHKLPLQIHSDRNLCWLVYHLSGCSKRGLSSWRKLIKASLQRDDNSNPTHNQAHSCTALVLGNFCLRTYHRISSLGLFEAFATFWQYLRYLLWRASRPYHSQRARVQCDLWESKMAQGCPFDLTIFDLSQLGSTTWSYSPLRQLPKYVHP